MSAPLNPNSPVGESEFSHGYGLQASPRQRGQYSDPIDPEGPWELSVYERDKAIQRTNPADPGALADVDGISDTGTPSNWTGTKRVLEP